MNELEVRFEAVYGWFFWIELFALIVLGLAVIELIWDLVSRKKTSIRESAANGAIGIVNVLLERTLYGLVFVIGLFIAEEFAFNRISYSIWSWAAAILLADFTYYWMHRWEHEVRILWAYHSVHHSSSEFDLTTALRLAWTEGVVEWIFFVPMILMGFDVVQTVVAIAIVVNYQGWIHTQKIGKLGFLDKIFNTPSTHRVHHGQNARYIDKNYGGILIIWDRLFGTYEPETEPVVFGITKPPKSANPVTINFHEFIQIAKDCIAARNFREMAGYIFRRPGWRPGQT